MTEQEQNEFSQNMAEAQGAGNTPRVPIKERQQDIRKELDQIAQKDSDNLSMGEAERDIQRHGELTKELAQIQQLLEPMEISEEDLRLNQEVYDKLGFKLKKGVRKKPIDLEQELRAGNIILPTKEQQELAMQEGMNELLIVPGRMPRREFLSYFAPDTQKGFNENFERRTYPYYHGEKTKELLADIEKRNRKDPSRPKRFYAVYLNSQLDYIAPFLKTGRDSFSNCLMFLTKQRIEKPELNLRGLTLEEYILLDCLLYIKASDHVVPYSTQGWTSTREWTWLLDEEEQKGCLMGRLKQLFGFGYALEIHSSSDASQFSSDKFGTRFCVFPYPKSILIL